MILRVLLIRLLVAFFPRLAEKQLAKLYWHLRGLASYKDEIAFQFSKNIRVLLSLEKGIRFKCAAVSDDPFWLYVSKTSNDVEIHFGKTPDVCLASDPQVRSFVVLLLCACPLLTKLASNDSNVISFDVDLLKESK